VTAYYNEIDPYAAEWLRNLIAEGHIAPGVVDERDIRDVSPDDLRGYAQCHFFAGIGVWSHSLRRAGWEDSRPAWTGSCPCQPFSAAGGRAGFDDERHLWPHWHWLIEQCRPAIVFGEQVSSKDGLGWLDLVSADLQGAGYAFEGVDLCGAGFGAPHIRQRLWFVGVAESSSERWLGRGAGETGAEPGTLERPERLRDAVGLDHHHHQGPQGHAGHDGAAGGRQEPGRPAAEASLSGGLADALLDGAEHRPGSGLGAEAAADRSDRSVSGQRLRAGLEGSPDILPPASPTDGFWRAADWLFCRDGKWRPVEPGTFPLAHGAPARVGRLRAYGNAVIAEVAVEFITAVRFGLAEDLA
jgi:DNA (cytosine-5)-methyltransferase 1